MKYFKYVVLAAAALALGACSHKAGEAEATAPAEQTNALAGEWKIDDVVVNDSLRVTREDIESGVQSVTFGTDSSYVINTNCNTIQGSYTLTGDSLTLEPGLMTEMACENMRVEELLRVLLPELKTVSMENDSVTRLNSDREGYVILKRKA